MRSRTIGLTVLLGLVLALLTAVASPFAPSASAKPCHPPSYVEKYGVYKTKKIPTITHKVRVHLAPGDSGEELYTVAKERVVTVSVETKAGIKASAGKVLAKAELSAEVTLKGEGKFTKRTSFSRKVNITNNTKKNRLKVAFSGVNKFQGKFWRTTCTPNGTKKIFDGSWVSYESAEYGTVACWLRAASPLAAEAKRRYC